MLSDDLKKELLLAAGLHERAVSDYAKCVEFNRLMAGLLDRLEENDQAGLAEKVMGILINCQPKEGSHCEKASLVENQMQKISRLLRPPAAGD